MSNQAGLGIGDIVHNQEINEYPEDWKREYARVSTWVKYAARTLGGGLVIRIIDPQSLVGMWTLIRHRVRSYPTMIIDGREKFAGWEASDAAYTRLTELLARP